MKVAVILVVITFAAVLLDVGCVPQKPISPGTPKNEVLKRYGNPDGWYKFTSESLARGEFEIVTVWRGSGPEQEMPSETIWVFEYKTKHGGKPACIWFVRGVVDKIDDGSMLKETK
jgi:hypothetical protein